MESITKTTKTHWALIGLGSFLFNLLFWQESLGVNLLLFTLFALVGNALLRHRQKMSLYTYGMMAGVLYGAVMVVIQGSFPAKLLLFGSALLAIGFAQEEKLRTVFYAVFSSFQHLLQAPVQFVREVKAENSMDTDKLKSAYKSLKFTAIPLAVTLVFWWIFRAANPVFNEWMNTSTDFMLDFIGEGFALVSWGRILFLLLGLLCSVWIFTYGPGKKFLQMELLHSDDIVRERKAHHLAPYHKENNTPPFPLMSLKREYRTGMLLMVMVTCLAAFVNMIDVVYVWVGFQYDPNMNLSQFVHEGTYLLILSILLSMGIMLYFFRRNLNFYLKQEKLRWVAYTWIVQNVIMCISVAIRNYHYIHYYGITYKRIGVYCFLALTFIGLVMLFIKIKEKKSAFYLLRTNAWALYGLILFLATFNWDMMIAEYNLSHWNKENGPYKYLLEELSDKALPVLHRNKETLAGRQFIQHSPSGREYYQPMEEYLEQRIISFVKTHNNSWLSWTWSEDKAYAYFISQYEYQQLSAAGQEMGVER